MLKNNQLLKLVGASLPIIQAPMAGAQDHRMAVAVSNAGAIGSVPCALLTLATIESEIIKFRQGTNGPLNLNFFCHTPEPAEPAQEQIWKQELAPFYAEYGIDIDTPSQAPTRMPFDEQMCQLVEAHKPEIVSFHFGLPEKDLLERVKAAGCLVLSSATTVEEALWLEANDCDVIIAQGVEAGGHRAMFLNDELASQPGLFALLPQVVDAVSVPVIAAGAIADGRSIAAAFTLGATAVQIGTAFLLTDESLVTDLHRHALQGATDDTTVLTNLFTGKPARGLRNRVMDECGPINNRASVFPTAGAALAPLKAAAEQTGRADFSSLWAGQAARLCTTTDAHSLTITLYKDAVNHAKQSININ